MYLISASSLRIPTSVCRTLSLPTVNTSAASAIITRRFFGSEKSKIDTFRQQEEQRDEHDKATSSQSDTTDDAKRANAAAIRKSILNASLPYVLKYGWTREAIQLGAASINYPGVAHGLFPAGGIELINHFVSNCDRLLVEQLTENPKPIKADGLTILPQFAYVSRAIRKRIQMLDAVRDRWPQALAMRSLPPHSLGSLKQTLHMVDDICYLAGDRSADVSSDIRFR